MPAYTIPILPTPFSFSHILFSLNTTAAIHLRPVSGSVSTICRPAAGGGEGARGAPPKRFRCTRPARARRQKRRPPRLRGCRPRATAGCRSSRAPPPCRGEPSALSLQPSALCAAVIAIAIGCGSLNKKPNAARYDRAETHSAFCTSPIGGCVAIHAEPLQQTHACSAGGAGSRQHAMQLVPQRAAYNEPPMYEGVHNGVCKKSCTE